MPRFVVSGKGRKIYVNDQGKIEIKYDKPPATYVYPDEADFRADLDILERFGRLLDINADMVVV